MQYNNDKNIYLRMDEWFLDVFFLFPLHPSNVSS